MAVAITTRTVRVYQVDGKGKTFRQRPAAYRSAAMALLHDKCETLHHWQDGSDAGLGLRNS